MNKDYPLYVKWSQSLNRILDIVEKYPKSVRYTVSGRIANISLDIVELIIEAIYTKNRKHQLYKINLNLEKLRVLFRLSYERQYISIRQYEYISKEINEAGKMTGGWMKADL